MKAGRSVSSVSTSLAGTNRSGAHRRVPGSAGSKAASTESSAGGPADCQVVSEGGERPLGDHQVVNTSQLSGNSEQVRSIEMADAAPEGGGVEIIHPSPTDYNPAKMPRTVQSSTFVRAVNQGDGLRVLIEKLLKKNIKK